MLLSSAMKSFLVCNLDITRTRPGLVDITRTRTRAGGYYQDWWHDHPSGDGTAGYGDNITLKDNYPVRMTILYYTTIYRINCGQGFKQTANPWRCDQIGRKVTRQNTTGLGHHPRPQI